MAFENISKHYTTKGTSVLLHNGSVAETRSNKNAEFIALCFNLQQKYDISKFEECVDLMVQMIDSDSINTFYTDKIEQLLKEVKK